MAGEIENATNTTKKEDICLGLIEAYKNISCCCILLAHPYVSNVPLTPLTTDISDELLTKYMLPGLQQLLKDTKLVVPQQEVRKQKYEVAK